MTYLKHEGLRAITPEFREAVQEWLPKNDERVEGEHPFVHMTSEELVVVLEAMGIGNNGAALARIIGCSKGTGRSHIDNPRNFTLIEACRLREYANKIEGEKRQKVESLEPWSPEYQSARADMYIYFKAVAPLYYRANRQELEQAAKAELEQRWLLEAYASLPSESREVVQKLLETLLYDELRVLFTSGRMHDTPIETLYLDQPRLGGGALSKLREIICYDRNPKTVSNSALENENEILAEYIR